MVPVGLSHVKGGRSVRGGQMGGRATQLLSSHRWPDF